MILEEEGREGGLTFLVDFIAEVGFIADFGLAGGTFALVDRDLGRGESSSSSSKSLPTIEPSSSFSSSSSGMGEGCFLGIAFPRPLVP